MVKVLKFCLQVTWTQKNVTKKRKDKSFDFKIFKCE